MRKSYKKKFNELVDFINETYKRERMGSLTWRQELKKIDLGGESDYTREEVLKLWEFDAGGESVAKDFKDFLDLNYGIRD